MSTEQKAAEMARIFDNRRGRTRNVITATEPNDARLSLLETEWALTQAKYGQIVAAARLPAGL
jgi:hypothetical protein